MQMENVFRDFRYAIHSLSKDRKFVFVAVFALALGIGASTVVFVPPIIWSSMRL